MKFDENLVSIHAYLCADGYVIKNPSTQKHKYYYIGFRNTNLILLKDFQKKFFNYFNIKPRLIKGERCVIQKKELYEELIKNFDSFYSKDWRVPDLNPNLIRSWLRAFFDCEAWVFCKTHQNRHIGVDSINEEGLNMIIKSLNKLGIKTIKKVNKKRGMFRIFIYSKKNLERFSKEIGFLHPEKKKKLNEVIRDYVRYIWIFPTNKAKCKKFIKGILKQKCRINRGRYIRIISKEKENLINLKKLLRKYYNIHSLVNKRRNGLGTIYYEMNINKREDVQRLISLRIIPNIFKQN